MHHIEGLDRDQAQFLPARVDDYVEADNPVRFIDAFVDGLDLQEAGFARVQPKPTGRPGFEAVADKGYYKGEDIQACEEAGIDAYVARPQRGSAVRDGLFRKDEFRYDGATDAYLCPGGHRLEPRYQSVNRGHSLVHYCNREACRACPLKPGCTSGSYRRLSRWSEEAVLDRMEARLITRPDLLQRRREIAEHPFGSIKQWMNQGYFLIRSPAD
jgi:hypothetical protein